MTLTLPISSRLRNPGREYKDTRHNIGFMFIDRIAVRLNARGMKLQSKAIVISTLYEERKIILAKPQTYMNLSGQSVQGLLHSTNCPWKICLLRTMILIFLWYDTHSPRGGPGGQRGMASTIDHLGTKDFPRLRLGIGRPPGRMDPKDYVLQDFSKEDIKFLPKY